MLEPQIINHHQHRFDMRDIPTNVHVILNAFGDDAQTFSDAHMRALLHKVQPGLRPGEFEIVKKTTDTTVSLDGMLDNSGLLLAVSGSPVCLVSNYKDASASSFVVPDHSLVFIRPSEKVESYLLPAGNSVVYRGATHKLQECNLVVLKWSKVILA